MTATTLPPVGDVFACVPDAARVDLAELRAMRQTALEAGRAGDLTTLDALRERMRVIHARWPGDTAIAHAILAADHTVGFQRRKVQRGQREGWL